MVARISDDARDRRWFVELEGEPFPLIAYAPSAVAVREAAVRLGYEPWQVEDVRAAPPLLQQPDEIPLNYLGPRR